MALTEVLTLNTESVPSTEEVFESVKGSYDTYWSQFGELSTGDGVIQAGYNQAKLESLTTRLYDATNHTGNKAVDNLSPANVAEEWYLSIGSLNKLYGGSAAMMLAAAILWERPATVQKPDPNIASRFVTEVSTVRKGQIPERVERALSDNNALIQLSLSGQAMLDIARIPEVEHLDERLFAVDMSYQINYALTKLLSGQPELNPSQKRVLSDALKTQYDAKFEYLYLKNKKGGLLDSDYESRYNQVLVEQVNDTLRIANKITNGDLNEHYSIALMRYAFNTWREEYRHIVRSTTRRQDEPHDGFKSRRLPTFSYDAQIIDVSDETQDLFVQLKMEQSDRIYARGIFVIDNVLQQGSTNIESR